MSADDTDSTLEAAREILFGAQHRVHDGRIAQIEEALAWNATEAAAKANAVDQRLSVRIDEVIEQLSARIAALEGKLHSVQERLRMLEGKDMDDPTDD
jgi:hypothetical protein